MKRQITATILLLTTLVSGLAANYTISWNPSPSAGVTGYRVYSSTNGTVWKLERGVAGTNAAFTNISAGVNFFGISATNAAGSESAKAVGEILSAPSNVQIIEQ